MPFPDPLRILLQDQVILSITGALSMTRKRVVYVDTSTYRNTYPNGYITIKPSNLVASAFDSDTATLQDAGTVAGVTVVNTNPTTMNSRVIVDDVGAAIPPRMWEKPRTRVEFWDDETLVGLAMTMSVTTVNADATITVPNNLLLTPGQGISGAGIPSGATVLYIPPDSLTTAVLSHLATAGAAVTATLTGSNYCGGYWEDEELGNGNDIQILQ